MKWWAAAWFPGAGLWKQAKAKGLLEAMPVAEFLGNRREERRDIHNSLWLQAIKDEHDFGPLDGTGTDPPTVEQPIRLLGSGKETAFN